MLRDSGKLDEYRHHADVHDSRLTIQCDIFFYYTTTLRAARKTKLFLINSYLPYAQVTTQVINFVMCYCFIRYCL